MKNKNPLRIVHTIAELRESIAGLLAQRGGSSVGLVPTMGALHAGHARLAETAVAANAVVVTSIFVNPLQFGDAVDLERYPRTLDADAELLQSVGVDLVFAPDAEQMYPSGDPMVRISSGALGTVFEGASRPGHFDGALTVVAKLLHAGLSPAGTYRAYFGQKDAQQLTLVRRMVADLNFPVEIVGVPTVRDTDGLALSSRNRFLAPDQREAALVLFRSLRLLKERADAREPLDLDSAIALVESAPGVKLDYFEVVDPETLAITGSNCQDTPFTGQALALIAAQVGQVRLIDNQPLGY